MAEIEIDVAGLRRRFLTLHKADLLKHIDTWTHITASEKARIARMQAHEMQSFIVHQEVRLGLLAAGWPQGEGLDNEANRMVSVGVMEKWSARSMTKANIQSILVKKHEVDMTKYKSNISKPDLVNMIIALEHADSIAKAVLPQPKGTPVTEEVEVPSRARTYTASRAPQLGPMHTRSRAVSSQSPAEPDTAPVLHVHHLPSNLTLPTVEELFRNGLGWRGGLVLVDPEPHRPISSTATEWASILKRQFSETNRQ